MEDALAVLSRARRGDGDAFRALVEHHGKSAFGLAFRLTGSAEDAEEAARRFCIFQFKSETDRVTRL